MWTPRKDRAPYDWEIRESKETLKRLEREAESLSDLTHTADWLVKRQREKLAEMEAAFVPEPPESKDEQK